MKIFSRSRFPGALTVAAACMAGTLALPASAETVLEINGAAIDSVLVDMYIESRTQKPAQEATPAERDAVIQELTDIWLLTTQPNAKEIGDDPMVKAQIELTSRGVLAQAVAADFFAKNQASDAEIQAEYEAQLQAAPPQQFKARHILVETQGAATDLIGQLSAGDDFAELAKAHSTGPTGPNGGDLGWFSPEQMVPPFSQAVMALGDGEFTREPVQTQFGWHVILREESRENQPPTLESVRDVIKQRIEQAKFQAYIEAVRAEYTAQ